MTENDPLNPDWVHLPHDVEEVSLWSCLHDGVLISCGPVLPGQSLVLRIAVDHLLEEDEEGVQFILKLDGIASRRVLALTNRRDSKDEPSTSWRHESVGWHEFLEMLKTNPLEIYNAGFASGHNSTSIRIGGYTDSEDLGYDHLEIYLSGSVLNVFRSDDKAIDIDSFIALGRKYWDELD